MSNPLRTPEDYKLFLYTLVEQFPDVRRSTVTFVRRGATLTRVTGEVYFDNDLRLEAVDKFLRPTVSARGESC